MSKLCPLLKNPKLIPLLPRSHTHLVVVTATQQEIPPQKKSSIKLFHKMTEAQETEEHPYSVVTAAKSVDRPRLTGHFSRFTPNTSLK